jgi:hypothetical protein
MKKRRLEVHLDPELNKWLDDVAKKPGVSKSAIASAALKDYLDHGGRAYVDPAIIARMNKVSSQLARVERNQIVLLETMGLYIAHALGVSGVLIPEEDRQRVRTIGADRFAKFVEHVGKRLASEKNLTREVVDELDSNDAGEDETQLPATKPH